MVTADHDHDTGRSDGNGDPPAATPARRPPLAAASCRFLRGSTTDPAGAPPPRRSIATTRAIPDRTSSAAANSTMTSVSKTRSRQLAASGRSADPVALPDAGTVSGN